MMKEENIVRENLKNLSKEDWNIVNNFIYGGALVRARKHIKPMNIENISTTELENLCVKINNYIDSCYDVTEKLNRVRQLQGRFLLIDEMQLISILQVIDIFKEEIQKREG
jgi:hypothetical protein